MASGGRFVGISSPFSISDKCSEAYEYVELKRSVQERMNSMLRLNVK